MPAKTKYRNRRNKTRRRNNKTRRYRHRTTSSVARLMKGGQESVVDNDGNTNRENTNFEPIQQNKEPLPAEQIKEVPISNTSSQPVLSDSSDVDVSNSLPEPISAEPNQVEGSNEEQVTPVATETNQVEEPTEEQNIDKSPSPDPTHAVEPEYKYDNLIVGDEPVEGIEKIPISKEDLTMEDNVSVLGTQVPNTNYYIDLQGVRREFKEGVTSIWKVNIVDVPTLEQSAEGENTLVAEANTALVALGAMLLQIYEILPEYMEVDFEGKRYLISKQNPYIVVDNEQPLTAEQM